VKKKIAWTLLAGLSATVAAAAARGVWRLATGEEPPGRPMWAKLITSPLQKRVEGRVGTR
jgi:hypothetical protein